MATRGRPPFEPTKAQRRRVSIAAGAGMSHDSIAQVLGISRTTLLKHFGQELTVGAAERRMEVLEAVHRAAKRGNVAAAKAYSQLVPTAPSEEAPEGALVGEGKKARANREAQGAQQGTEWESLLTPPSSVQ
jgi:AcrR family transcriptional regulator